MVRFKEEMRMKYIKTNNTFFPVFCSVILCVNEMNGVFGLIEYSSLVLERKSHVK